MGADLERLEDDLDPRLLASIAAREERMLPPERALELWSGKEALAKALGDALAYDPRHLPSPATWPSGRAGGWRAERIPVPAGHVGWVCWRDTGAGSSREPVGLDVLTLREPGRAASVMR